MAKLVGVEPGRPTVDEVIAQVRRLDEGIDLHGDDVRDHVEEGRRS